MAVLRAGSYQRIPSGGQLHNGGDAARPQSCRGRAMRAARSSAPLLVACLLSSLITYGVIYGLQQRAATAMYAGDRLEVLTGTGVSRQLPGARLAAAPRAEGLEALQMSAAARLLERDEGDGQLGSAESGPPGVGPTAAAVAAAAAEVAKQQMAAAAARERREAAAAAAARAAAAAAAHQGREPQPQPKGQLPKPHPLPTQQQQQQQPAGAHPVHPAHPPQPAHATAALQQQQQQQPGHAPAAGAAAAAVASAAHGPYGQTGRMRVAVVNHAPYHLEIVAGWLHVLRQMHTEVIWYQAGQFAPEGNYTADQLLETQGFREIMGDAPYRMVPVDTPPVRVDFAVFVSPEYYEADTKQFLDRALPISSVMLVHNGRNSAIQRLKALAPRTHIAALSPHVAAAAVEALKVDVEWAMATLPFKPKAPCSMASINAVSCLHGFAIQGNFEPQRRNYTRVWDMLRVHIARGHLPTKPPLPPLHLHLVGRGLVDMLNLPEGVKFLTTVHFNERYPEYYERIHHAHALLLVLGSQIYVTAKMSSTIVSSLMTGVPVVADEAVLKAYTFLGRDDVFLMHAGEDEVDAMLRVLRKSPAEIYRVHSRVQQLAANLNARTVKILMTKWMPLPQEVKNRHDALRIPYAAR